MKERNKKRIVSRGLKKIWMPLIKRKKKERRQGEEDLRKGRKSSYGITKKQRRQE